MSRVFKSYSISFQTSYSKLILRVFKMCQKFIYFLKARLQTKIWFMVHIGDLKNIRMNLYNQQPTLVNQRVYFAGVYFLLTQFRGSVL
jgi:hypothetical protein